MPECTEALSELYYFVADRLDATLAAARAANLASLKEQTLRARRQEREYRRQARRYELQIRHYKLEIAVNKAAIIAMVPFIMVIVLTQVGWVSEPRWFSFQITRFWFWFVICFVVAHAIVRGIVLRERKEAALEA